MRAVLSVVLPLVLPLALFLLWRLSGLGKQMPGWLDEVPWVALLATGVVLSALVLAGWSLMEAAPPGATFEPPRFEDGKIRPGGFK